MNAPSHQLVRPDHRVAVPTPEIVDGQWSVPLLRELLEVRTDDGVSLVVVRKRPVDPLQRRGAALLVHGLGQNRYTWDLPQRSLANYLVAHGYEVFIADLRGHGLSHAYAAAASESFEAHVRYDLPALVRRAAAVSEQTRIFVLGHSLGGTLTYCAAPGLQASLRGLVSLAGPAHLGRGGRVLPALASLAHRLGRLGPGPGLALGPLLSLELYGGLLVATLPLFDLPLNVYPLGLWYPRSIETPILAERIRRGFDRTSSGVVEFVVRWMATGRLVSSCGTVDYEQQFEELRLPLFFALGAQDALVQRASMQAVFDRASSRDKTFRVFGPGALARGWGHFDLICGRAAPRVVWPALLEWMSQH